MLSRLPARHVFTSSPRADPDRRTQLHHVVTIEASRAKLRRSDNTLACGELQALKVPTCCERRTVFAIRSRLQPIQHAQLDLLHGGWN